jgi:hypothetical protein
MGYDEVKRDLQNAGASMRCSDVIRILESLGFVVRECGKGKHRVFKHPSIPSFLGGSFDCGHGRNPEVKKVYVKKILRVLDEFEAEIRDIAG